jgi:hypothetical protein
VNDRAPLPEAEVAETPQGREPRGDGWFVLEVAARHGASVTVATTEPREAYDAWAAGTFERTRFPWPQAEAWQ